MVRFGKWEIFHKRIEERGLLGRIYIKILGCVSLSAYNYFFHFKRAIKEINITKIFDAGCGKGDFTFYLAERFPNANIVGWDLSDPDLHDLGDNIKVCNKIRDLTGLKNTEFHEKDLRDLSDQNYYDFIFSIHVLEHIPQNQKVIENFFKALKPNGFLHIQIPSAVEMKPFFPESWFKNFQEWEEEEHIGKVYTLPEFKTLLEKVGFKVHTIRTDGGFLQSFSWQVGEVLVSRNMFLTFGVLVPLLKLLIYLGNLFFDDGNGSLVVLAQKTK